MKRGSGLGLYPFASDEDPMEVTREEMLALKAFNLVYFSEKAPGRFHVVADDAKAIIRFLKQWRAAK